QPTKDVAFKVLCHRPSEITLVSMGYKDRDYAWLSAPVSLHSGPSPPHSEMIDDDRIPISRHLRPERPMERSVIVLSCNIWQLAEQAAHRGAYAHSSIAFPADDDPFDPVYADASGAIAGAAHSQDCELRTSAAKA